MKLEESLEVKRKVLDYIPNDISFDILLKLPVKSLKRFTCVCHFWAYLFKNPLFMKMYCTHFFLSKYEYHHNFRLLLKQREYWYEDISDIFLLSGKNFENKVKLDWPPPFQMYREDTFILGSAVNGIICIYQGSGFGNTSRINQEVVLWNPSTREFKVIPSGSFERTILKAYPPGSVFEDLPIIPTISNIHGFGYDLVTNDYKLIRYFCIVDYYNSTDPNENTLWQIYSLKSNSWRDLKIKMPNYSWNNKLTDHIGDAIYFRGMCHWWGCEDYFGEVMLVSFNLAEEVVITTPTKPISCGFSKYMVVLNDSIAMIEDENIFYFSILILGEIGVAESWTRLFRIGPLSDVNKPIGVGKNGDIFLNRYSEIENFNLDTEMIEEIGFSGEFNQSQIIIYNDSLLPIGGIHS
ncbi:F-box/kelch-repeat protein At3g06240-like [Vicia villosa]|uniref:F-box/kelch-repeat protein At3g06240-like n=1 Tax=Vicia villosa TaxID=3911 RepID=UPI00273AE00A|nr:F-box/kelch-repeat protein At3g06240-like [Vicia villosa]